MKLEIKGLDKFQKGIGKIATQLPYALSRTINDLAFDIKNQMNFEINDSLDVRVKSLGNAFRLKKSSKSSQEAIVYVKKEDWRYNVLVHHTTGGTRKLKGLEKLLRHAGFCVGKKY